MKRHATTNPPGRNPDRTETAVFGTLMAAFLGGSPFVAYAAGRWADAKLSRAARLQRAALRQVPATLLEAAVVHDTPAKWRAPDGQLRTGPVSAPAGTEAGRTVLLWVNQAGDPSDPPMPQSEMAERTELAQGLAAAGFALGLTAIGTLARKRLSQRT
jgi:hypothetical protein